MARAVSSFIETSFRDWGPGIHGTSARAAALLHLAASLPTAVLARLLGIHPDSAERWAPLLFLKDVIEAGEVTPVVDRTYPLIEAPAAIRHVAEGHARGKVVVTV